MTDQPQQIGGGRRTLGTSLRSSPNGRWPRLLAWSPTTIRDQIAQLTKATGVQEVMVQDVFADPKARARALTRRQQRLPRGEVAVQGARTDARPLGDRPLGDRLFSRPTTCPPSMSPRPSGIEG